MMVDSVELGVAGRAGVPGVAVAGKTGTAQNGPADPYTLWFTGFAPAEAPEVVVTVVVEDGGGHRPERNWKPDCSPDCEGGNRGGAQR
jgi:penicillin-binding protein A